ncbi:carbohydrate sulfotransferase 15 [Aplysia californica]|uniref:Carbohydrate sulfotransferase 15 n=1 Tax=Aplysia californica TaxID=6500 RepID=A0ABM0JUS5_APLCA|nr:carbohydrate sulfotransferase 15 [Aplysia californica]XP_005101987.1 carbohydrate sulfotransferase 15 [Aplysia californica]
MRSLRCSVRVAFLSVLLLVVFVLLTSYLYLGSSSIATLVTPAFPTVHYEGQQQVVREGGELLSRSDLRNNVENTLEEDRLPAGFEADVRSKSYKVYVEPVTDKKSSQQKGEKRKLKNAGINSWESTFSNVSTKGDKTAGRSSGGKGSNFKAQISQVAGLLSQDGTRKSLLERKVDPKLLQSQIRLLVAAMMSKSTMLDEPARTPTCMGETEPTEVEDLLCIPKPEYLPGIKNPCWFSSTTAEPSPQAEDLKLRQRLRCLPYFHLLGVGKSGTTDLWNRLMWHPHIVSNHGVLHKEALWWAWRRYGFTGYRRSKVQDFNTYVDIFNNTARQVQRSLEQDTHYHKLLITGDGSPPDFWDFRGWRNISQNRGLANPQVITPHLMKHFYDKPKFILLFKDPVDRLYSDYFFVGGGLTSLDFHNDILATIDMLASCVKILGLQRCFYDPKLYQRLPVRLPFACYSVFMREWLRVFPKENFLFLKTEDYAKNPQETLKEVINFLDLAPLDEKTLQTIAEEDRSRVTVQKHEAGPMMEETKVILRQLLGPCSEQLRSLLHMDKFRWDG